MIVWYAVTVCSVQVYCSSMTRRKIRISLLSFTVYMKFLFTTIFRMEWNTSFRMEKPYCSYVKFYVNVLWRNNLVRSSYYNISIVNLNKSEKDRVIIYNKICEYFIIMVSYSFLAHIFIVITITLSYVLHL